MVNGGYLVKPTIVKMIYDPNTKAYKIFKQSKEIALEKEEIETIGKVQALTNYNLPLSELEKRLENEVFEFEGLEGLSGVPYTEL